MENTILYFLLCFTFLIFKLVSFLCKVIGYMYIESICKNKVDVFRYYESAVIIDGELDSDGKHKLEESEYALLPKRFVILKHKTIIEYIIEDNLLKFRLINKILHFLSKIHNIFVNITYTDLKIGKSDMSKSD